MPRLCSGCMFLKQDILYAGTVKNLKLETFSLLVKKTLTSSKHCLYIICLYTEALIAVQFFFVRVNKLFNNTFCCCRCGNKCAKYNILYHTFYCCISYIYRAPCVLINMSRFIQLDVKGFVCFCSCSHLPFNVYRHIYDTPYEFYHSTTESSPVYVTSLFQQVCISMSTAACFMKFSPTVRGVFCFAMRLAT